MPYRDDIRASVHIELNANLIAYMICEREMSDCSDTLDQRAFLLTQKIENRIARCINHFEVVPSLPELFMEYYSAEGTAA